MGSAEVILLDMHAAIWFTTDSGLGRRSQAIADEALANDCLAVSAISFWEVSMLVAKRRLRSLDSATQLRKQVLDAGINEVPLTGDVAIVAGNLEGLHGDPADRFVVATAIVHNATLVTADERLLEWRNKLRRQNAEK
jgi:PIN domain nuclease of toxin-antitoxin system